MVFPSVSGMPRRRKTAEGPDSRGQDGEEEEEEKRRAAKKKRSFVDAFIVISDSDGEVSAQAVPGPAAAGAPVRCAGACRAIPLLFCEMNPILFD